MSHRPLNTTIQTNPGLLNGGGYPRKIINNNSPSFSKIGPASNNYNPRHQSIKIGKMVANEHKKSISSYCSNSNTSNVNDNNLKQNSSTILAPSTQSQNQTPQPQAFSINQNPINQNPINQNLPNNTSSHQNSNLKNNYQNPNYKSNTNSSNLPKSPTFQHKNQNINSNITYRNNTTHIQHKNLPKSNIQSPNLQQHQKNNSISNLQNQTSLQQQQKNQINSNIKALQINLNSKVNQNSSYQQMNVIQSPNAKNTSLQNNLLQRNNSNQNPLLSNLYQKNNSISNPQNQISSLQQQNLINPMKSNQNSNLNQKQKNLQSKNLQTNDKNLAPQNVSKMPLKIQPTRVQRIHISSPVPQKKFVQNLISSNHIDNSFPQNQDQDIFQDLTLQDQDTKDTNLQKQNNNFQDIKDTNLQNQGSAVNELGSDEFEDLMLSDESPENNPPDNNNNDISLNEVPFCQTFDPPNTEDPQFTARLKKNEIEVLQLQKEMTEIKNQKDRIGKELLEAKRNNDKLKEENLNLKSKVTKKIKLEEREAEGLKNELEILRKGFLEKNQEVERIQEVAKEQQTKYKKAKQQLKKYSREIEKERVEEHPPSNDFFITKMTTDPSIENILNRLLSDPEGGVFQLMNSFPSDEDINFSNIQNSDNNNNNLVLKSPNILSPNGSVIRFHKTNSGKSSLSTSGDDDLLNLEKPKGLSNWNIFTKNNNYNIKYPLKAEFSQCLSSILFKEKTPSSLFPILFSIIENPLSNQQTISALQIIFTILLCSEESRIDFFCCSCVFCQKHKSNNHFSGSEMGSVENQISNPRLLFSLRNSENENLKNNLIQIPSKFSLSFGISLSPDVHKLFPYLLNNLDTFSENNPIMLKIFSIFEIICWNAPLSHLEKFGPLIGSGIPTKLLRSRETSIELKEKTIELFSHLILSHTIFDQILKSNESERLIPQATWLLSCTSLGNHSSLRSLKTKILRLFSTIYVTHSCEGICHKNEHLVLSLVVFLDDELRFIGEKITKSSFNELQSVNLAIELVYSIAYSIQNWIDYVIGEKQLFLHVLTTIQQAAVQNSSLQRSSQLCSLLLPSFLSFLESK